MIFNFYNLIRCLQKKRNFLTISFCYHRCGMVYVDPEEIRWFAYVKSWIGRLNPNLVSDELKEFLQSLFDTYVEQAFAFIKKNCTYAIYQVITWISAYIFCHSLCSGGHKQSSNDMCFDQKSPGHKGSHGEYRRQRQSTLFSLPDVCIFLHMGSWRKLSWFFYG